MTNEDKIKSFPSPFAPPTVKQSENYCRQYSEAFHQEAARLPVEAMLSRNNKNLPRWRKYGKGEQSTSQYKELTGLKREKRDGDIPNGSFRNLNYEIFKIGPRLRSGVVNKVLSKSLRMRARAIDPRSISAKRKYKSKLLEFIVNKEEIERFEYLSKLGLERPVGPGEMPPMSAAEIDPYVEMNPKDITSMEVLDFLTLCFAENNWEQQGKELVGDIVDTSLGGTRQYIDVDNKIKSRRVLAENSITNRCIYPDFRDLIRFGEYIQMTVSELKRITNNKWGEDAYRQIANTVAGSQKYSPDLHKSFDADSYTYAYDHEVVTVLDCMWYSTDTEVHVEYYNEVGNRRVKQQEYNYVPFRGDKNVNEGRGLTDTEFNKLNEGKKRIMRTEFRNVYTCCWVVDTKFVYNHGLMKNMLRPAGNIQDSIMPVVLESTDFVAPMAILEQPLDQVQLNYLQYQSHMSASKPPGIALEKRMLARLNKGVTKWDPIKNLELYAETGNIIYDGYDQHDTPLNNYPFQFLANGIPEGAFKHLEMMHAWIDTCRDLLGLNILTEGQTPPERMGKEVAKLSFGASDSALAHITDAYRSIYQRTARNMYYLLQNNVQRMNPEDISESLGMESYKYFMLNKDIGLLDMGILLEEGPDDHVKERISQLLNLMVENNQIPGEDAIMIEMVDNPYRQVQLIRKHRFEREQQAQRDKERLVKMQGDENTKTAVAAEQEKQKAAQMEHDNAMDLKVFEATTKEQEDERKFTYDVILKKLEQGGEANAQDKASIDNYILTMIKGQLDIQKAKAKPKPKSKVAA